LTDVTNPFKVDLLKLEYLCTDNSGSYNYGALTYKYSYNNDVTIPPTAGTDGVVIKGYIRAQDDGSWVPGGKKYRVFSNLGLKIEKNIGQHVYYGDANGNPVQIPLTDNDGNEYYDISNNNGEVIDPIHYVILPKDGTWGIDGIKLKITYTYDYDIDEYSGESFVAHVLSNSYTYIGRVTYDWA